jgi:hypothetical protein
MVITTRTIRSQSPLLGGGHDSSGNPSQGKDLVVGTLAGTYADGGVAFSAADVGLTSIDYIKFRVTTPAVDADGTHVAAATSSLLFIYDEEDDEIGAVAFVVEYMAFGDAARNVQAL